MQSQTIRTLRKKFREESAPPERKHSWATPAPLIINSVDDPTTMFNSAGMQQFVPYLMGKSHPLGDQLYNIQGCVRTTDIDEVGDLSHLTYFEMMGNRSLGAYFKQASIQRSRAFLTHTDYLGLDPQHLAVSVFAGDDDAPRDEESARLRQEIGVSSERIAYLGKSDNRWGPAGATGPCGPDTEIFYWIGPGDAPTSFDPEQDEQYWLEIWNNVFMAYYKDEDGTFSDLAQKNVDTGMGFERICMVIQGQEMKQAGEIAHVSALSVYDIDIFQDILRDLGEALSHAYPSELANELDRQIAQSYRIIADHIRTSLLLIDEGLIPSNEGRGYVLRRIIRRAYYHLTTLHDASTAWIQDGSLLKLLSAMMESLTHHYTHLAPQAASTVQILHDEMQQFQTTLHKGEKKFEELLSQQPGTIFSGKDAFLLYDTYGVPLELTEELLTPHGMTIDKKAFAAAMQTAQQQSRAGGQAMFAKDVDRASYIDGLPPTIFVGYDQLSTEDIQLLKDFTVDGQRVIILDRTPFYAEGGGQKGDSGKLVLDDGTVVQIRDVQQYGGVRLHFVE